MKQCSYPLVVSLTALLSLCPVGLGNAAPLPAIDAGSTLQNTAPPKDAFENRKQTPESLVEKAATKEPESAGQTRPEEPAFLVKHLHVQGALPEMNRIIQPLLQKEEGKQGNLQSIEQLAQNITKALQQQGYLVAFAYVPPQAVSEGDVTLTVVPGTYGELILEGSQKISQERLRSLFFAQRKGQVIEEGTLEKSLRIANELAGIEVKGALRPGKEAGTADLVVTVKEGKSFFGSAYSDNWGNRYSGRVRFGLDSEIANSLGQGEVLSLGGQLTSGSQIHDYHMGYRQMLNDEGLTMSVSHSQMHYLLGDTYQDMGASGKAVTDSVTFLYPLTKARDHELTLSLGYEQKRLEDLVSTAGSDARKKSRAISLGVSGSSRDDWQGGGVTEYSLTHIQGHLGIEDQTTLQSDELYNHSRGSYQKEMISFQRIQAIAEGVRAKITMTGQIANKNLDSSEKLYLGGATGVRAYPQGESGGDQGYLFRSELYWRMPGWSRAKSEVSLISFFDYGTVWVNKNPWSGAGENRKSLMGAGLGLAWNKAEDFTLRLDYAWKIGSRKAENDRDRAGRLWLQMIKGL